MNNVGTTVIRLLQLESTTDNETLQSSAILIVPCAKHFLTRTNVRLSRRIIRLHAIQLILIHSLNTSVPLPSLICSLQLLYNSD